MVAAIEYLERAVKIARGEGQDVGYRANAEFSLAKALHQAGDRVRARQLAVSASELYEARGLLEDAERVDVWLLERDTPARPWTAVPNTTHD